MTAYRARSCCDGLIQVLRIENRRLNLVCARLYYGIKCVLFLFKSTSYAHV